MRIVSEPEWKSVRISARFGSPIDVEGTLHQGGPCEGPLMEGLPNVERIEFPKCGHYPQYTHAPVLAEVVRRFLTPPA